MPSAKPSADRIGSFGQHTGMRQLPSDSRVVLLIVVAAIMILVADLYIPLGVAVAVPYIVLVLFSLWSQRRAVTLGAAIAGTLLTIVGFIASPSGGELWKVLANRFLAIFAVWCTTALCLRHKRSTAQLYSRNESLVTERQRLDEALKLTSRQRVDLVRVNEDLSRSRSAAINMMRDAEAARRKAEDAERSLRQQAQQLERANVDLGREITERKRTDNERAKAKEAAEAANRAKSEFLANMSHEIRTPMTAILGFIELLSEGCPGQCNFAKSELPDHIETIVRNAKHLLQIVNSLLDLSKIEAGRLNAERIACSPRRVVSEVVSSANVRASAKGLTITVEYDGPVPETIQTDPTRLRQILLNLVDNAIKFTEVGGVRLVVRLKRGDRDGPRLQIQVIDTGMGMSEEQMAQLFVPFSQADTSTTRKFAGIGLGLTVSKRLAELLGGDISIDSVPGKGSTLTVTVGTGPLDGVKLLDDPSDVEFTAEKGETPGFDHAALDCRVLLAEDGPDNQRLIAFLLKKAGAEVTVAENGRIAHDLALAARDKGTAFDVILMDMQMPVMDGYDATAKLREAAYRGPIIALTAHAMSTDRDKCLNAGCDDYMAKPIDHKKLIPLVAQYASHEERRYLSDPPV